MIQSHGTECFKFKFTEYHKKYSRIFLIVLVSTKNDSILLICITKDSGMK